MTKKTSEKTVHKDVLMKHLKSSAKPAQNYSALISSTVSNVSPMVSNQSNPIEDLKWIPSLATQVSKNGLLHESSFLQFLQYGNEQNILSWENLLKQEGQKKSQQKAIEAINEKLENSDSVVHVLRSPLTVAGQIFSLWNPPLGRGGMHSARFDFEKNEKRTIPEISVHGPLGKKTGFRKPDQSFYINGLLFSMIELKAQQTGQTAKLNGRKKLAGDFQEFAFGALLQVRQEFQDTHQQDWPGIDADERRFPNANHWRKRTSHLLAAYTKTAWLGAVDMSEIWIIDDTFSWLCLCDEALSKMMLKTQGTNQYHFNPHSDTSLMKEMVKKFAKLPDVSSASGQWSIVKQHLSGLLGDEGIAREIRFWHYPLMSKDKSSMDRKRPTLKPRAPQRVALQQAMMFVDEYYAHEKDDLWMVNDLISRLKQSLPVMSTKQMEKIVEDRFKYKNGQDAYSVLIQGAAGLGKTNIAIWLALELYNKLEPTKIPGEIAKPLFDRIVILTDRVELRSNIAKEAKLSAGTKSQVISIETKELLVKVLTGEPITDIKHTGTNIFVVNLQKFPSIYNDIKQGNLKLKHTVGRTAFIIDEVHRSQNGEYNEKTLNSFLEGITEATSTNPETKNKNKNLIIGLTASPSKSILARFGQWRPGTGPSDKAFWVPHFAYAMNQAVEDGYILNPLKGLVRLGVKLNIKTTETLKNAGNAEKIALNTDNLYEDERRQEVIAKRFSEIFASTTMMAMPHGSNAVRVGKGKAMITVRSIRAAISMARILRSELKKLSQNSKGTAWEKYADLVKDVAENRVFVLYSNPGVGQGNTLDPCALHNPQLGSNPSENDIINGFKCINAGSSNDKRNSIIIVVDKLLTGFDERTLHTLLIDRPMKDIALFQAMCRVNRVEEGKSNCLVIDSCHDEANSREAVRVFERYGNLATSDLDGLEIMDGIRKRRIKILKWPGIKNLIKNLEKPLTEGERAEEIHFWTENLSSKDLDQATKLRELIGGYLFNQSIAKPIMKLNIEDIDENWLGFLAEIHKLLKHSSYSKDTAEVIFEIDKIDFDDADLSNQKTFKKPGGFDGDGDGDLVKVLDDDLMSQIEKIQDTEEEKNLRRAAIREFIDELFIRIEQISHKHNNNEFQKMIDDPLSKTPYNDILSMFTNFFDGATSDRSWIGKNDQDKRRYRDVAGNRLELLLGDYRMR